MFQLPDFSSARILVAGDVLLDRYWSGDTSRISPEAPVPVVRVTEVEERPGGAGNVALGIAALGGRASVLGLVGKDEAGAALEALLADYEGVTPALKRTDMATITKLRVLSRHQQLIRLDFEAARPLPGGERLGEGFAEALAAVDIVVLSDYGKGALLPCTHLIEQARAATLRLGRFLPRTSVRLDVVSARRMNADVQAVELKQPPHLACNSIDRLRRVHAGDRHSHQFVDDLSALRKICLLTEEPRALDRDAQLLTQFGKECLLTCIERTGLVGNEPQDAKRTPAHDQRDAHMSLDARLPERWQLAVVLPGVLDDHQLAALCRDAWYALTNRHWL